MKVVNTPKNIYQVLIGWRIRFTTPKHRIKQQILKFSIIMFFRKIICLVYLNISPDLFPFRTQQLSFVAVTILGF